jgi:hypothetical protein
MNTTINLSEIRSEYKKAPQFSADGTHEAFIVKLYTSKKKFTVGVNYWTKEEAVKGEREMDGIKCVIIEKLYNK